MPTAWIEALCGGLLIGLSASLLLLFQGRVAGISGILKGLLRPVDGELSWRLSFILGLLAGGFLLVAVAPTRFQFLQNQPGLLLLAGVLVGFGTAMSGGCTSGHGVCGISRFSFRSIVATMVFIASGVLAVFLFKKFGLLP